MPGATCTIKLTRVQEIKAGGDLGHETWEMCTEAMQGGKHGKLDCQAI